MIDVGGPSALSGGATPRQVSLDGLRKHAEQVINYGAPP